jgi:hypothetical protein
MTAAAMSGHRSDSIALRALLVVAALIVLGTASWFAGSWVDSHTQDTTCGSVIQPRVWIHQTNSGCERVMIARSTVSAVLVVGGGALLYLGLRKRPLTRRLAIAVIAVSVVACGVILIVNEVVRSGGGLWYLTR